MEIEARFWSHADWSKDETICWPWTGYLDRDGYGRFRVIGQVGERFVGYAHRVAYELEREEIPDGLVLDHLCRFRACVNPWHLESVTQGENLMRADPVPWNRDKTRCINDHEFTPTNTYQYPNGDRACRACRKVAQAAYRGRQQSRGLT